MSVALNPRKPRANSGVRVHNVLQLAVVEGKAFGAPGVWEVHLGREYVE